MGRPMIVCVLTEAVPSHLRLEGTTEGKCDTCGQVVVLSPWSTELVTTLTDPQVLCEDCAIKAVGPGGPDVEIRNLSERAEIADRQDRRN